MLKADYLNADYASTHGRIVCFPGASIAGLGPVAPKTGDPNPFYSRFVPRNYTETNGLTGTTTIDFGGPQLKLIGSYRRLHNVIDFDVDGSLPMVTSARYAVQSNSFSGEAQFTGKLCTREWSGLPSDVRRIKLGHMMLILTDSV